MPLSLHLNLTYELQGISGRKPKVAGTSTAAAPEEQQRHHAIALPRQDVNAASRQTQGQQAAMTGALKQKVGGKQRSRLRRATNGKTTGGNVTKAKQNAPELEVLVLGSDSEADCKADTHDSNSQRSRSA